MKSSFFINDLFLVVSRNFSDKNLIKRYYKSSKLIKEALIMFKLTGILSSKSLKIEGLFHGEHPDS